MKKRYIYYALFIISIIVISGCGINPTSNDTSSTDILKPSISYYDYGTGILKYAKWTGATWEVETVDNAGDVGRYSSLAFNSSGYPCISYHDLTNYDLKYARWNGTSWAKETVDSQGTTGYPTSLKIYNNDPIISYSSYEGGSIGKLKCAKWTGTTWEVSVIDPNGDTGYFNSITYSNLWVGGSVGYPSVAYVNNTSNILKFAYYFNSTWEISNVTNEACTYVSIGTCANWDNPKISYYSGADSSLKYAEYLGGPATWEIETVDNSADVGLYSSIAIDSQGYPQISYFDDTNDNLKYAKWTGTTWAIEVVDSTGNVGQYTSIVIDGTKPYISYFDMTNSALKCAAWTGTTWEVTVVDTVTGTSPHIGQNTCIRLH